MGDLCPDPDHRRCPFIVGLVVHLSCQPRRHGLVSDSLVCAHEIWPIVQPRGGDIGNFGGMPGSWNLRLGRLGKKDILLHMIF